MASILSRVISAFSSNKPAAKHVRSLNVAANGGAWSDDPRVENAAIEIGFGRAVAGMRTAGLSLNDAIVSSGVGNLVGLIVGATGVRVNTADPMIDAEFNGACFDPGREQSLLSLQEQWVRSWVVFGEALGVFSVIDDELSISIIRPDRIDASRTADLGDGRRILGGVEFDEFDRETAIYVLPETVTGFFPTSFEPIRIEKRNYVRSFERLFPGQTRGISPFSPVLPNLNTASVAVEAGLRKQQVSALLTAFVTSPDGSDVFGDGKLAALEPGATIRLNPGETVESVEGGDAGDLPAYLRMLYQQTAASLGTTYEDLTGDLSNVNYSSYRAGHLSARRRAELRRKTLLMDGLLIPLYRRWRAIETLKGRTLPEGDPQWIMPVWAEIDRVKEATADETLLSMGVKSRREIVEASGRDFETVSAEITADPLHPFNAAKPKTPPMETQQ